MSRATIALLAAFVSFCPALKAQALPAYASTPLLSSELHLCVSPEAPLLPQAFLKAGYAARLGLGGGFDILAASGLCLAPQSAFSRTGVAYRSFSGAWLEGGLGWSWAGALGLELGGTLYLGGSPGSSLARAMAGASLGIILRDPRETPGYSALLSGGKELPRWRAELALPIGFLHRGDSSSFSAGLCLRIWQDRLGIEAR